MRGTREREGVELGFVEQLYTFADAGRLPGEVTSLEPASSDQSPSAETVTAGRTAAASASTSAMSRSRSCSVSKGL